MSWHLQTSGISTILLYSHGIHLLTMAMLMLDGKPQLFTFSYLSSCTHSPVGVTSLQFHLLPLTETPSFTPADTKEAIRLVKSSTAIGPDGMTSLHLKKLAHGAINYLTNIFNLSISTGHYLKYSTKR